MSNLLHSLGLPAAVIAVGFAVVARVMGAVTDGGAAAGIGAAFLLMLAAGFSGFVPLFVVFLLTLVATRWGYARKESLGVAERSRGRNASQVLANLGASAICAAAAVIFQGSSEVLLVAAMASLAEAAADTVSSEMGEALARRAYLITDFRVVPIGTNGAISLGGTLCGSAAALVVGLVSYLVRVVDLRWLPVIVLTAIGGMLIDSILGATLENAGRMGNNAVNFVSSVVAADLALFVVILAGRVQYS